MADSGYRRVTLPRIDTTMPAIPGPSVEDRLLSAVANVLALPRNSIELFDSFTDLGGDKASALTLRRACMSFGLGVKTSDILRCQTLAELQTCVRPFDQLTPISNRSDEPSRSPSDVFSDGTKPSSDDDSCGGSVDSEESLAKMERDATEKFLKGISQVSTAALVRPMAGYLEGKLVAFITMANSNMPQSTLPSIRLIPQTQIHFAGSQVAALRLALETSSKPYLIPNTWIVLEQMSTDSEGHVDRRRLQTWVQNLNEDQYQQITSLESDELFQEPLTDTERLLQKIVSRVLRVPQKQVGMNFSFSQLGGDDISVMLLVSACRTESILLKPEDILQSTSLGQLALLATWKGTLGQRWNEESLEGFKLSPMQQMYFDTAMGGNLEQRMQSEGSYRFNQSTLLRIRNNVTLEDVHAAIETVVAHHSMLRARFRLGAEGWTQRILADAKDSYGFGYHSVSTNEEVMRVIEQSQVSIDIENGPVFAVNHFNTSDGQQMVYLIAHHLVVDLLSWRIIIHDLDELLREGTLFSERSMPFQRWNELSEQEIQHAEIPETMPFKVSGGDYSYWGLENSLNTYGEALEVGFSLSSELTAILQTTCNQVFRTESADIYLAALLLSFCQTFHDRRAPVIWNQEHGREPWSQDIDIAETVGWFNSLCPIGLGVDMSEDFLHMLRKMKDVRRSIARHGWKYFASRYFGPQASQLSAEGWPFEILFTYAGSVQQLERENGVLEQLAIPGRKLASPSSDIGPDVGRIALFEVSATVDQGAAKVKFLYNRNSKHQERIRDWIQSYEHLLLEAIGRLRYRAQELTLADVPLLNTTYEGLAKLNTDRLVALNLSSARDIEDVYPVTATQQEILISQTQSLDSCHIHTVYELSSSSGVLADQAQVCVAWQQTVAKYPALRTVFIDSISEDGLFDQVVLRKCSPDMLFIDAGERDDPVVALNTLPPLKPSPADPRHRLSVCKTPRSTFLKLEISQALCDTLSVQNLMADLKRIYNSSKAPMKVIDPSYTACVEYLGSARLNSSLEFWRHRLRDTRPCLFPRLTATEDTRIHRTDYKLDVGAVQLDEFCRSQSISRAAVMQLAWGLVLRAFTGNSRVCFGYLTSDREGPTCPGGLQQSVGCFQSTIACSLQLSAYIPVATILRTAQDDLVASLPHQHVCSSEVQHALGLRGEKLFNTCFAFQEDTPELKSRFSNARPQMALSCTQAINTLDHDISFSSMFVNGQLTAGISHRILTTSQAQNIANTFGRAVLSILESPSGSLGGIDLFTDRDYAQLLIHDWEVENTSEIAEACIHTLVSQQAKTRPEAPAVCAWDGEFTYRQLTRLVSRLSRYLVDLGVQPGVTVPVVLEKGRWAVVAMLAVMKAGGCFVPIDGEERNTVETSVRQLKSKVALATDMAWKTLESVAESVIIVNDALFSAILPSETPSPKISARDAACILFSPSALRSKDARGIVFSHSALSSAFLSQGPAFKIDSSSRVMQLSSYNVDTALVETLTTLVHGGCVCIPSADERIHDFSGAVRRMQVTWTYLTPVLARRLSPACVPSLKVTCFRTRRLDEDTCKPWMEKTTVLLAYGAPDICPLGISMIEVTRGDDLNRIARPFLGKFWIVNPEDHRKLMPIGAIGELIIESPTLAYKFTPGQPLLPMAQQSELPSEDGRPKMRYFKSGHQVRYMEDGMMQFISSARDDVSINGKAIPVAEIEQQLRRCLGQGVDLVVDAVKDRDSVQTLAVFVELGEKLFDGIQDLSRLSATTKERNFIAKKLIETSLKNNLPAHMIPSIFIPVKHLPITPSLKINRRKLQKMVSWMTHDQLMALSKVPSPDEIRAVGLKPLPLTQVEERMRSVWASLLEISEAAITGNQGFLKLGGGRHLAAQLVVACRKQGLSISIQDILRDASLTELCQGITLSSEYIVDAGEGRSSTISTAPISGMLVEEKFLHEVIAPQLGVERDAIKDVAEASAAQIRYLETGMLKGRANVNYLTFNFTGLVPAKRLELAVQALAKIHPILRTAFVAHDRRMYQAALRSFVPEFKRIQCPSWRISGLTEKLIKKDQSYPLTLSIPMTKFFFLDSGKQSTLIIRLTKAQYDDASIALLLQDLKQIFNAMQSPPSRATYFDFMRSAQLAHSHGALEYWTSLLDGARMTQVVAHSKPQMLSSTVKTIQQDIPLMSLSSLGISFDTVLKAAWAMVLGNLSGRGDVMFGEVIDGRHMRLSNGLGASGVLGPAANTIPVRVRFSDVSSTPLDLLQYVHGQRVMGIPFENMGWIEIVEKCTKLPYWTQMSTAVQHRYHDNFHFTEQSTFNLGSATCKFTIQESAYQDVYDLFVSSTQQSTDRVDIALTFCENRIPITFAELTLKALCSTIELLTSVSMMHPIIPSATEYANGIPQIPLPQAEVDQQATQLGFLMSTDQRFAVQALISSAWTQTLDPRTLGVPEPHIHNAAFYDLWGSLIPAAQLANYLTQELPKLGIAGLEDMSISMEEVVSHPTMLSEFELVARKLRDRNEPKRRTVGFSPRSPTAWGRSIRRLTSTVVRETIGHERTGSNGSTVDLDRLAQPAIPTDTDKINQVAPSIPLIFEAEAPNTRLRPAMSLILETDDRGSMESMTSGSTRSDEEEEEDIVSPLSPVGRAVNVEVGSSSGVRRTASSIFGKMGVVSPVSVASPM